MSGRAGRCIGWGGFWGALEQGRSAGVGSGAPGRAGRGPRCSRAAYRRKVAKNPNRARELKVTFRAGDEPRTWRDGSQISATSPL